MARPRPTDSASVGRRRVVVVVAVAVALGGGVLAATTLPGASAVEDDPSLVAPTTAAATTAPTAPSTTLAATTAAAPTTALATTAPAAPTTTVALPVPERVPPEPAGPVADVVIGRIEIPRLGLDVDLHQGVTLAMINRGPSHWPGTALPGRQGNAVIAGHRVTHSRPFRHIDQLEPGDEVVFTVDGQRFTYLVESSEVVAPDAMWITDQTPEYTATLFACHPVGSTKQRLVVHLEMVPPT